MTQIPGKVPSVGSIVWCYFPLEQGPPRHPCLVLAVDAGSDGLDWLTVVLGKSVFDPAGDHRTVYDNELVLYANDPGFSGKALHATKFCFAQWCVRTFPYTMEHFHIPPGQMWPKVGSIDMREPKVTDRLAEIGELIDIDATVDAARAAVGVLS